jgi:asparagine synthase (glutamine-hydrolysing)
MADRIWFDPATSMNSVVVDILAGMDKHVYDHGLDLSHLDKRDRDSLVGSLRLIEGHLLSTLHRNDRLGMAWDLECRFPFLGHDLASVCLSGPARQRLRWSRSIGDRRHPFVVDKWVVREFARRWLPTELAERPKLGFPVTLWDRARVRTESLVDGHFAQMFSLGPTELDAIAANAGSKMAFRCLLTEIWLRTTVERASIADVEAFVDKAIVR